MPARMTADLWRRGAKNSLICVVELLVVWLATTLAISLILGQSLRASWLSAYLILLALLGICSLGSWFYGRNTAGPVILDCGAHPSKRPFLFNAASVALLGTGGGLAFGKSGAVFGIAFGTFSAVFGIVFGIYWLIMAFGRLQIRQNGIWSYWGLLKWDRLKSYRWEGDTDCTLMLQAKSRLPFRGRGALPVPMEHKNRIDELLQQHCSSGA